MYTEKYNNQYRKYVNYIKKYREESNAATASEVDSNANVENKNIATCNEELCKREKIGCNRLLMIDKITELFGSDLAEEYIRQIESHELYKHDETSIYSYCVSITMYPFLFNGLKDLGGISTAPTNLDSFCGSFINLVFAVAAQFAGAVSTPEFLMYMDYFIRKDYGDDYYKWSDRIATAPFVLRQRTIMDIIKDKWQQVVYSINQPAAARGYQAVFWNDAYFDKPYFNGMFSDFVFPDGTEPKWDSVNWLQKQFMNWFNNERLKEILTFPVETMNLLNDGTDAVDKEYADFQAEMYSKGHSFFTYTSDSVDSLASCCFDIDTKFITSDGIKTFADYKDGDKVTILTKYNKWAQGTVKNFGMNPTMRLFLTNDLGKNKIIIVTFTHQWFMKDGTIKTSYELKVGDTLLNLEGDDSNWTVCQSSRADITREVWCVVEPLTESFTLNDNIVTHNCRLRNEVTDNTFSYTLGAGGVSTGSKGVMTININRLVQNAVKNNIDISDAIREQVEKCHKYLYAYNQIVKDNFNAKLLQVYNAGYIRLEKQYLTIGINGFVEGAEFLGIDISPNEKYFEYGEKILKPIYELNKRDRTKDIMFNTEFVPAENLGVKNAKWDKKDGYFVPRDCYNSYFYKVEDESCNILDKFILHGRKLTQYLDGGSALHCNLEEHLTKDQYRQLLKVAIKEGCSYYTFNVPNTICNDCGYISKHKLSKCPKCGSDNIDYATRVIGYLKRVSKFSEQRQIEENKRFYDNEQTELKI